MKRQIYIVLNIMIKKNYTRIDYCLFRQDRPFQIDGWIEDGFYYRGRIFLKDAVRICNFLQFSINYIVTNTYGV